MDFAVLVSPEEKTVRLIFEESASKRGWQNNFNFPIKPYKNQQNTLWFARGWARAYKSANDLIMEKLIEAIEEKYGSVINYLREEIKIDEEKQKKLQDLFLE